MSADVETLRRAAAQMRENAQAATPGPWVRSGVSIETDHECSPNHDCWPVGDTYSGMKPDGSTYPRDLSRADAEHIASWHPPVALAVANWLEACADFEGHLNRGGSERDEQRWKPHQWEQALAVARAYLGEQP